MANFFGHKRDEGGPIPLIYYAIQVTDSKKVKADGVVDKIFTAARNFLAQLGIDLAQQVPHNNFQKLPQYEREPLIGEAIDFGYGLGGMQHVPCGAQGLATQYLEEIQESPGEEQAVIVATLKCGAGRCCGWK